MKNTKRGHMLKLHSYYESYVYENICLTTLNFSFTFLLYQILNPSKRPSLSLSFALLYALDALLSFGTALSLIVSLVLLVETTSERTDLLWLTHLEGFSTWSMAKKAEKLSLWRQEHAAEAFHMVDQKANSEAENRGQVRTFKGPLLVTYSYQLGLTAEKF